MKKAVKNIAMTNTLINPHINDTDSIFLPQLRQTATNTGKTDKKETTTNKKVNDEGKTITKLPQTGASVVVIAGIALTVVAGIVVARKISK